jgi:hypothetical protein
LDHVLDPHHSILVAIAGSRLKITTKLQSDDNLGVLDGISLLFEPLVHVYASPNPTAATTQRSHAKERIIQIEDILVTRLSSIFDLNVC